MERLSDRDVLELLGEDRQISSRTVVPAAATLTLNNVGAGAQVKHWNPGSAWADSGVPPERVLVGDVEIIVENQDDTEAVKIRTFLICRNPGGVSTCLFFIGEIAAGESRKVLSVKNAPFTTVELSAVRVGGSGSVSVVKAYSRFVGNRFNYVQLGEHSDFMSQGATIEEAVLNWPGDVYTAAWYGPATPGVGEEITTDPDQPAANGIVYFGSLGVAFQWSSELYEGGSVGILGAEVAIP